MAKRIIPRGKARKPSAADQKPTVAERNRAIRQMRKLQGLHIPQPVNCLVQDSPAHTIDRCKGVIKWLAHIEQPFTGGELDAAEADVLHMVADALEHAERVVREVGSLADAEVARG